MIQICLSEVHVSWSINFYMSPIAHPQNALKGSSLSMLNLYQYALHIQQLIVNSNNIDVYNM